MPQITVVVPMLDECDNVAPLVDAVRAALTGAASWELLLVDDGSTDGTAAAALGCAAADPRVRVLRLARHAGQTAAMLAGFDHARGEVVVSLDGDLQNDPADIPLMLARLAEGYDVVTGYRDVRPDRGVISRLASAAANVLVRLVTGVQTRDTGCTLRAYRRDVLVRLRLYSDLHRFIPVLAVSLAGARVAEVAVRERPRRAGRSKYGLGRLPVVLADLLTLLMIRRFAERPLSLFALGAVLPAGAGVLIAVIAVRSAPGVVLWGVVALSCGLACFMVMLGLVAQLLVALRTQGGRPVVMATLREWRA